MKILHTSDWHLGHTIYGFDRHEEQTDMLRQIVGIVCEEQPDAFLLSGDVYHTSQPSASTQRLFADVMTVLHRVAPKMRIYVTAGNHDSPSRHDIYSSPWQALNVHTVGALPGEGLENMIFEIAGKGFVIAVPYVYWRNMPENLYHDLVELCRKRNPGNLPVVMMAHTAVKGVNYSGHDHGTDLTVGGIDCIGAEEFGRGFDYLALGHIHKPQTLQVYGPAIRYSGTPMDVSFDECYEHSVTLVEIEKRGDIPKIREIPIKNPRPLITLPLEGSASFETVMKLVSELPDSFPAYIRLNVEVEDFLPIHAREKVLEAISGKKCRFCTFNVFRKEKNKNSDDDKKISVSEFRDMAPIDVARRYADEMNIVLSDEQMRMLREIFDLTSDDENP